LSDDAIRRESLRDLLAARDWTGFARAYNGPGFRKNKYDDLLRRAYDHAKALIA